MLKIGDFSRLTQIPIKTLRYYDEMGLLKPAEVDQFTGYRYYTLDQLPRLNRIIALKDSGFSLDQITQLLTSDLTATELRDLLRLKHLELQQQVEAAQARLTRLEIRLKQIEMEDNMPTHEIITKKLEPQRVLAIRQLMPTLPDRAALLDEVSVALRQHHVKPTAPCLLIYHHAGYRDTDLDLEIAIPIDTTAPDSLPLSATHQLTARTIPAIPTALTCLLRGSYDQLVGVYTALNTYLHTHGHNYLGPAREVYLRTAADAASPADYLTEVQYPIGEFTGETIVDGLDLPTAWDDTAVQLPLSRRARTALEFASAEAVALQQSEITPTHLLLGLLRDRDGFAVQVLIRLGLTIDPLRAACPHGDSSITSPAITDAARQIVTLAHTEAHQLGHDYIGTEHLLLALTRDPAVMRLLAARNLTADHIRTTILQTFNH